MPRRLRRRQSGITLLLFTVGLVAVIGMAGVALDLGRAYLQKTKLQNALDAAALDAAQVLYATGSTAQATTAAQASYSQNIASGTPAVTFSSTWPFGAQGASPKYVKVEVSALPMTAILSAAVLGSDTFTISGTAVAGPEPLSGSLCGVPVAMCGDTTSADKDCTDGNGCFGIANSGLALKDGTTGPGNYGLIDMGSGASAVADGMAGTTSLCVAPGDTKTTETGKATSTTSNGLNTRFGAGSGAYSSQSTYPPDVITTSPMTYSAYKSALASGSWTNPGGVPHRRMILVPVVDCSNVKGKSTAKVLGSACVFLTQKVPTSGSTNGTVYGEMATDACTSTSGTPSNDPSSSASRIVLYQAGTQS